MPAPDDLNDKIPRRNIWLSSGQDFVLGLEPRDENGTLLESWGWAAGTTVTLEIGIGSGLLTWNATVTDQLVSWHIESSITDTVGVGAPLVCRVTEPTTPPTNTNWFIGRIRRDDPAS